MDTLKGLLINKAIIDILSGNTLLTEYVDSKIYPIVAPDNVLVPFIVITRNNIDTQYTKDISSIYDTIPVIIYVISDDYKESIDIAQIVRNSLEGIRGIYEEINIDYCILNSASEDYGIDGYIQKIEFIIKCR